jgi:hypothetical protein
VDGLRSRDLSEAGTQAEDRSPGCGAYFALAIEAFEVGRVLNNQKLNSMYFVVLLLLLQLSIPVRTPGAAFSALLADTPPMGWNSWDGYGTTINEADFKANADWLAKHLRPYGWEYVVVDADWFVWVPAVSRLCSQSRPQAGCPTSPVAPPLTLPTV